MASQTKQTKKVQKRNRAVPEIGRLREGSKQSVIVQLLKCPSRVTLQDLMVATGWQAHSVRGFLRAGVGEMGLAKA